MVYYALNHVYFIDKDIESPELVNQIKNFRYENVDCNNNTILLKSNKAIKKDDGKYFLEGIKMIFNGKDLNSLDLFSQAGEYDEVKQSLFLEQGVNLLYNNGMKLSCMDVYMNFDTKNLYSRNPVKLQSENYILSSGEVEVKSNHKFIFTKSPQIVIKKKKVKL